MPQLSVSERAKLINGITKVVERCAQQRVVVGINRLATMGTVSFLSVFGAALVLPSVATSYIRQSDLPHDKWLSIDQNIEYLPIFSPKRSLVQDDHVYPDTFYKTSPFVEGESEYDEYQQAWRYLGFMIDCNDGWVAGQDDDGSYDGGTGEGCQRYLLWAAVSTTTCV
jgi:hypothetical protein